LYRLGVSDQIIQRILRHSNVNVTLGYYVKTARPDVVAGLQKLEQKLTSEAAEKSGVQNLRDTYGTVKPASGISSYGYGIMTMDIGGQMRTIAAGVFKANCLALMDEIRAKREPVIITKRGKPVVKVIPVKEDEDEIFGFLKGKLTILGDVVVPVVPLEEWGRLK
jgi:prevent-host-death family protein